MLHSLLFTLMFGGLPPLPTHNGMRWFVTFCGWLYKNNLVPNPPQQNGVVERKNIHLLEVTRLLLIGRNIPSYLWGEALSSIVYLINRVPSSVLNLKRPLDVISHHFPLNFVNHLSPHIFGCHICAFASSPVNKIRI